MSKNAELILRAHVEDWRNAAKVLRCSRNMDAYLKAEVYERLAQIVEDALATP